MSTFAAVFKQSPTENKRYVADFTLDLASGENIVSVVTNITQTTTPVVTPNLAVASVTLLPAVSGQVYGFAFFVSGGVTGNVYEIQFLVTTSIGQILEQVVQFTIQQKV